MKELWNVALTILTEGGRDEQQKIAKDLVDEQNLQGYRHVQTILSASPGSMGDSKYLQLMRPFISVITHSALLDCLSVDTYVGRVKNISRELRED